MNNSNHWSSSTSINTRLHLILSGVRFEINKVRGFPGSPVVKTELPL